MNTRDATGATPMIHAVRGGFLDVVALLVEKGAPSSFFFKAVTELPSLTWNVILFVLSYSLQI